MRKLIYFVVFCALVSCNSKSRTGKSDDGLVRIDMEGGYPKKEIILQDIAEVEYIPLETRTDVLLAATALEQICMSDSLIVARSNSSVFIFDRRGRYVRSFDHSGRSGEEYALFGKLAVDFDRQEIYIHDNSGYKICVYDFDGLFRRALKLPKWSVSQMLNYDRKYLLGCCKESSVNPDSTSGKADRPYWLIDKESGEISALALAFQERILSSAIIREPDAMVYMVWPLNSIVKNGEEFLIADFGSDTIYNLSGTTFTPYMLKEPSHTWKKTPPVMGWVEFKTNRYTGIKFMELSWEKNTLVRRILYDRITGEKVEYDFMNQDFRPARKTFISLGESEFDLPSGYLKFKLSATELRNAYEMGKLDGKLKEIAATLDEDANPVLMLVKFRE